MNDTANPTIVQARTQRALCAITPVWRARPKTSSHDIWVGVHHTPIPEETALPSRGGCSRWTPTCTCHTHHQQAPHPPTTSTSTNSSKKEGERSRSPALGRTRSERGGSVCVSVGVALPCHRFDGERAQEAGETTFLSVAAHTLIVLPAHVCVACTDPVPWKARDHAPGTLP